MATNGQWIFESAMALMDELDEATGVADTNDTLEYKNRTLPILNMLRGELYPYSDNYKVRKPGKRPISVIIENLEDPILLDDYICQTVMPYGLAAHLLMQEDPSSANYFQQRYEELRAGLMRGFPRESEDIVDIYGGIEPYNEFSSW